MRKAWLRRVSNFEVIEWLSGFHKDLEPLQGNIPLLR